MLSRGMIVDLLAQRELASPKGSPAPKSGPGRLCSHVRPESVHNFRPGAEDARTALLASIHAAAAALGPN